MESKDTSRKEKGQEESNLIHVSNRLKKLKSDYFIQKFFDYIPEKKSLEIIKYNKDIQKRIKININNYKAYYLLIEIEIIPVKDKYGEFIKIKENKKYYHIYFNDDKTKEIKRTSLNENDKVSKINIIIDYQVKSLSQLFKNCEIIESIYFKKFYRNNITDMSCMFEGCSVLKKLDLKNFNTQNVTNMSLMFFGCSALKELNLNNFDTNNVRDMLFMFSGCSSLIELNLNSFKTPNLINIRYMFRGCSSLEKLYLNNFNTNNVKDMSFMFRNCSSLKELNLDNFNTDRVTNMYYMFCGCSDELKLKIKNKYKQFKKEAFFG